MLVAGVDPYAATIGRQHATVMGRDEQPDNAEVIGADRSSARDVARLAGVSTATVSRALNLPRAVDPATLLRVQAAIDKLRYVPHGAARALRSQRSAPDHSTRSPPQISIGAVAGRERRQSALSSARKKSCVC